MSTSISPTTTKYLWSCIEKANISEEASKKVDDEIEDLFLELITIGDSDVAHLNNTSFKKLVNWLSDPCRTAEEFNFTLHGLVHTDYDVIEGIEDNEFLCIYKNTKCPVYLGKIAAEALAVKRPVIEGSWELTGWAVLSLTELYDPEEFGWASNSLGEWIMKMGSDSSLCPNSALRIEFVDQLKNMIQQKNQ